MKNWWLAITVVALGCGDSASNNSDNSTPGNNANSANGSPNNQAISDRGGPASLAGFQWTADPVNVNGFELQLAFEFTDTEVIAYNTCDGVTTVSTSAPVRYTYSANIPQGDSNSVEEGDSDCFVEIAAGEFDFEIIDGALNATSGDETVVFDSSNGNRSIYGKWSASIDDLVLSWWMGNGVLTAEAVCFDTLSVSVDVPATYRNFAVIDENAENSMDGCDVSISASTLEYRFEGDDLIMIFDGQETRLSP